VVLVKKLRGSSNALQYSNVYYTWASDLYSNKDCAKEEVCETVTLDVPVFKAA